ncbi:hypothetical protein K438DRAFT_1970352 [Mycena galopus ATCC 62051]|nr:hypothetical protein K438DRAFT_1970352 [Mycena galopus ATCC 62051]
MRSEHYFNFTRPNDQRHLQDPFKTPVPSIRGVAPERTCVIAAKPDTRPKSRPSKGTPLRRQCHRYEASPPNAPAQSPPSPTPTQSPAPSKGRFISFNISPNRSKQVTYRTYRTLSRRTCRLYKASPPNAPARLPPSPTPTQNPAPLQKWVYLPQYLAESLQPGDLQDLQHPLKTPVPSIRGLAPERARAIAANPDTRPPQRSIYVPQYLAEFLQPCDLQDLKEPLKMPVTTI